MDEIQKVLVKMGRRDLAQAYYKKIAQIETVVPEAAPSGEAKKETAVDGIDISKILDKYKEDVWNAIKEKREFKIPANEIKDYLKSKINDPSINVESVTSYSPREQKSNFKKGWFESGKILFITFTSAELNEDKALLLSYIYKKSSPKDSFFSFWRDDDLNKTVSVAIKSLAAKPGQITLKEQLAKQKKPSSINDRVRIIAFYLLGIEDALTNPYISATMLRSSYVKSFTNDRYSRGATLGVYDDRKVRRRITLLGLEKNDEFHSYFGYKFPNGIKFVLKDVHNNFGRSEVIMIW